MSEYISYNEFRVFDKTGTDLYHDRKCPKLSKLTFNERDYLPVDELKYATPCKYCNCARFYFTGANREVMESLFKRYKISFEFTKTGNAYTNYAGLWWKVYYSPIECRLKIYNGTRKDKCNNYQYSCKCDAKKVVMYIVKFKSKSKCARKYNEKDKQRVDELFRILEQQNSKKVVKLV